MNEEQEDVRFWMMTSEQACLFFEVCEEIGAKTEAERVKVLEAFKRDRRVFEQTKEQIAKRIQGKKVLHIKKDGKHDTRQM